MGHRLLRGVEVADKSDRFGALAQFQRILFAARQHQRVEIGRPGVGHGQLDTETVARRIVVHALHLFTHTLGRNQDHLRTLLFKEAARACVLDLLDAIRHQDRHALALQRPARALFLLLLHMTPDDCW